MINEPFNAGAFRDMHRSINDVCQAYIQEHDMREPLDTWYADCWYHLRYLIWLKGDIESQHPFNDEAAEAEIERLELVRQIRHTEDCMVYLNGLKAQRMV